MNTPLLADTPSRIAIAMISGLLLLRLVIVIASPLELYADEAQYWRWGTTLDWGYYSKPPMIAWLIHLSTAIFGDSEWAVRLFAPILHSVAAFFLFLLSRQMFGSKAALITVAAYLLMPGIILSSTIISTDGVLFPFWSIALYMLWQLREGRIGWAGIALLGAAIGFGFLSKYAMLYFAIGITLATLLDAPTRKAILSAKGAAALAIALAVLSPHLAWNAANDFATLGHTVDNANLGGELFNLENLPKYLGDQMAVFGPVSFLALLAGLIFLRRNRSEDTASKETWLACFIVPVLVIIAVQAVLSRAHANWAATAYPAASVLVASIVIRAPRWRIALWTGIGVHVAAAIMASVLAFGPPAWSAALGRDNDLKRVRGWQDLADQLVLEAERVQPSTILLDEREIWHGLDYYTRGRLSAPLILWRDAASPENFAETAPMTSALDANVLVASNRSLRRPRISADFAQFIPDGVISVDLGHRANGCPLTRTLRLYRAHTFSPLPRTQAWRDRFDDQHIDRPPRCPPPKTEE